VQLSRLCGGRKAVLAADRVKVKNIEEKMRGARGVDVLKGMVGGVVQPLRLIHSEEPQEFLG